MDYPNFDFSDIRQINRVKKSLTNYFYTKLSSYIVKLTYIYSRPDIPITKIYSFTISVIGFPAILVIIDDVRSIKKYIEFEMYMKRCFLSRDHFHPRVYNKQWKTASSLIANFDSAHTMTTAALQITHRVATDRHPNSFPRHPEHMMIM